MTEEHEALSAAREALDRYGSHLSQCKALYWDHRGSMTYKIIAGVPEVRTGERCDCGLQDVLNRIEEVLNG